MPNVPLPLRRPRLVIALVTVLTLLMAVAATQIRVDNTPQVWLPRDLQSLDHFREFQERFGEDTPLIVFAESAKPDEEWRAEFIRFADALAAKREVATVNRPAFANGDQPSALAPYLESADGDVAALALLPDRTLTLEERGNFIAKLETVLADFEPALGPLKLAGADVITQDLDDGSKESLGGLSPLVLALMCGILIAALRSWRGVAAGLLVVGAVCLITLGLFALAGQKLNLVVATMPAILAVVTVAQFLHLFSRFQCIDSPGDPTELETRQAWWAEAIGETWKPCLLSALTTAAGLFALSLSDLDPIRNLGVFTGIGVVLAFLLSFSLGPALLVISRELTPRGPRQSWWSKPRAASFTNWLRRHSPAILGVAFSVALICGYGLQRLVVESNILTFFPPEHRVPQNYAFVEDKLFGLTPFELVIEGSRADLLSEETLAALESFLEKAMQEEELLAQTINPLLEPTEVDRGDLELVAQASLIDLTLPRKASELSTAQKSFIAIEGDQLALRTTLAAHTSSSNACQQLAERLKERLKGAFPEDIEATLTGSATILVQGQVLLLETQIRSFLLAIAIVTLVLAITFRSPKLLGISLLPNLLPVLITLGIMGLSGIPLNTATVTVAGIALGLIVDDTVHFLHCFWTARQASRPVEDAIASTLFHVGRPVVITSIAVAVGFGAFALAPFRPTLFFGLLIALTAVTALICDLVVLPALLLITQRRKAA